MGSALVVNLLWRLPRESGEVAKVLEFTLLLRFRKGDSGEVKVGNGGSSRGDAWDRKRKPSGRSDNPFEKAILIQGK